MTACYLAQLGLVNALGQGKADVATGLFSGDSRGMVLEAGWLPGRPARVGRVRGDLPELPAAWRHANTRNNRLLLAALAEIETATRAAIERYGPARVGVVLGTSTSGIAEGEMAIAQLMAEGQLPTGFDYRQQELGDPARFLARYLGVSGPAYAVSTACTSSAKAMVSARNLIAADLCDVVIAGGVDSLCRLTLNGFTALESTSEALCNPMSLHRRGINIGEGAALFLVTREPGPIALLGVGESSDAHHISAPDPTGRGAETALRQALADVSGESVSYVNLHATATPKNDAMESQVVARVLGPQTPCSGTKPLTGHTLGAAGATELAFCWLALSADNPRRLLPPHVWDGAADPELPRLNLVEPDQGMAPGRRLMLSNSFAFGGNNCCLLIGDAA